MKKEFFSKIKKKFIYGIFWGLGVFLVVGIAYVAYAFTFIEPGTVTNPTFSPDEGNVRLPEEICKRTFYQAGDVQCPDAGYHVIAVQNTAGSIQNPGDPPTEGYIICCRIIE